MPVAELTGGRLDYWVAKALNIPSAALLGAEGRNDGWCETAFGKYSPSTEDKHAISVFEAHRIEVEAPRVEGGFFVATIDSGHQQLGQTYLEAAMRAFVDLRFGENVPDLS